MMGFGPCYGYEGCAPPASNLSPLAPPFTVDRSIPKTNSNSLGDLAAEAPYSMAAPLSLHNWVPQYHSSRSDLFAKPNPEDEPIRGSKGYSTYFGAQPINSSSSASLPSDPNPITSNGIKTILGEAKPYYPSFVMPTIRTDSPAGLPDLGGYDLLSSSYASALNGSSHEDCADGLTGVEYTSSWGDLWNRPGDWNCGNERPNGAGSSNYENFMNQGSLASKGFSTFEKLLFEDDMRRREKYDKSFSAQSPKLKPIGYPKASILGSAILSETCSTEPSLEPATNPRNHKRSYGSYNEGLTLHDFGTKLSTSAAFPVSPTRLPPIGTGYLAPNSGSTKPVTVPEESPFYQSSNAKDLFDARQIEKCVLGTSGVKYNELCSGQKVSNITLEDFLEPKSDICSADKFSETLEQYNTVVDSPCWKGVPFSWIPLSKVPEATTPQQSNLQDLSGFSTLFGENGLLSKHESDSAMEGGFFYSKHSHKPTVDETENGKKVASVNSVVDESKDGSQVLSGAPECLSRSPGQSTSKIDVRVLIRVIHDISMMLLYHCSNDEFEVVEKDCETLTRVVSNLETCMVKNLERGPVEEPMLSLGLNSQFLGQVPDPRKKEMKDQIFDIYPPRGDEDRANEDNITQAIKKVLSENFVGEEETQPQARLYKNLWLEAEAAICAIRYKARFNRMKIEMEKDELQKSKDVSDNATDSKKPPSYNVSPVLSSVNNAKPEPNCGATTSVISNQGSSTSGCADDVMTRLRVLKCWSDDSKSINAVNELDLEKMETDAEDSPIPDVSIQDSRVISPNRHSDDVMSRYDILMSREDLVEKVEKSGGEEKEIPMPYVSIQDSCVICLNSHSDDVMSRYDILKSRDDVLNSRDAIDKVEKSGSEEKEIPMPEVRVQDSCLISLNGHSDDVMSQFNILKSREDVGNSQVEKMDRETNDSPVPVSDDVFSRYQVLKSREDLWDSRDSSDSNKVEALASEAKNIPTPAVSDNVMSRYVILKSRVDGSNSDSIITVNSQDNDKVDSPVVPVSDDVFSRYHILKSRDSTDSNKVEALASEAKNIPIPAILDNVMSRYEILKSRLDDVGNSQDSTDSQSRVAETSVLTRFHILKTRADHSSSFMEPETEQLLDVDLGFASRSNYWSISEDGLGEDVNENPERSGNQISGDYYDCSSSDWEHVMKEDVLGQN